MEKITLCDVNKYVNKCKTSYIDVSAETGLQLKLFGRQTVARQTRPEEVESYWAKIQNGSGYRGRFSFEVPDMPDKLLENR